MIQIQGTKGSKTGTAAAKLKDISPGTDDWCVVRFPAPAPVQGKPTGPRSPMAGTGHSGHKVTVTGQVVAGKCWFHDVETGNVVCLDESTQPAVEYMGTYKGAKSMGSFGATSIASAKTTLGAIALGGWCDNGTMGRKVQLLGADGKAIAPPAGQSWLLLVTGTVTAMTDGTAVEGYDDSKATVITVG